MAVLKETNKQVEARDKRLAVLIGDEVAKRFR